MGGAESKLADLFQKSFKLNSTESQMIHSVHLTSTHLTYATVPAVWRIRIENYSGHMSLSGFYNSLRR